jgi:hypothetical protein
MSQKISTLPDNNLKNRIFLNFYIPKRHRKSQFYLTYNTQSKITKKSSKNKIKTHFQTPDVPRVRRSEPTQTSSSILFNCTQLSQAHKLQFESSLPPKQFFFNRLFCLSHYSVCFSQFFNSFIC